MAPKITEISALEILDSQWIPTVRVFCHLDNRSGDLAKDVLKWHSTVSFF
jgi:hypothetical protein